MSRKVQSSAMTNRMLGRSEAAVDTASNRATAPTSKDLMPASLARQAMVANPLNPEPGPGLRRVGIMSMESNVVP